MIREEIIGKVMGVIDELGCSVDINRAKDYPIELLLDECGTDVMLSAPVDLIADKTDFAHNDHRIDINGNGMVKLPQDFLKLVEFKMSDWSRAVFKPIIVDSIVYKRQFNRTTRNGTSRPVVAIRNGWLEYFSIPENCPHDIERALCLVRKPVDENYPETLVDMTVWLTASKVLKVMNENELAKEARNEYELMLKNSYNLYN